MLQSEQTCQNPIANAVNNNTMLGNTISSGSVSGNSSFKRTRLNQTFMEAMKYPIIIVCAGAGYGKTTAVYDFVQEYKTNTVWVQISERDNVGGRFWENFSHSMTFIDNTPFAVSIKKLGFPDTTEKLKQFQHLLADHADKKRRIIVFDDCHFIENPAVIRVVEEAFNKLPVGITLIFISRTTPRINIAKLVSSDRLFNVSEEELRFTENELAQYLRTQDISLTPDVIYKIMQDTEGWAFAINYIARSYKKAPGYEGYLRNAMKTNIFRFMEIEIWDTISEKLQNFLVRLSLIDHLSVDLIALLAGTEKYLIDELLRQNAYVRIDSYINTFYIHPLFLEYLATKQDILSQEQKHETYTIAGKWCFKNGFKIDALSYYEKIGDYQSIVHMFLGAPSQIPYDISCYAANIFEQTPLEIFDTVDFLVSIHLRVIMCQGRWEDAIKLAQFYESRYIDLPKDNPFRMHTLSSLYYCWGISHVSMCLKNDIYDFDHIFEKQSNCYSTPIDPGGLIAMCPGPWSCVVGSSRKGSVQDFLEASKKARKHLSRCFINYDIGGNDLSHGEFKFYQGDIKTAESHLIHAMNRAIEKKHSGNVHRILFYTLRIAIYQGNNLKAQQAINDIKALLDNTYYYNRYIDHDITLCWYYCIMNTPDMVPDWLKEGFSVYANASFIENFANQMTGRYFFMTRNYHPLLAYINEMKQRESYLFGRVEMLAIEACVHYRMKDKEKSYTALEEAYLTASPNNIIMPFIELGKDMRTLSANALKNKNVRIPKSWLHEINCKSTSYAKRLAHVITEFKQASGIANNISFTPREREILTDLSHGLSRIEITISRKLSINTVKMLINNIYVKLGAENLADAIRIATERKIV